MWPTRNTSSFLGHAADWQRSSREFLVERVLTKDSCKKTLERWLVVANPSLKTRITSPKIWYLTGLYELADTVTFSQTRSSFAAHGGISAELLSTLGVPIGASAAAESTRSYFQSSQIKEPLVWAARYQLLDAKYLHLKKGEPVPEDLVSLGRKLQYSGSKYRDKEIKANYAELSLLDPVLDLASESSPMETDEYWGKIKEAQQEWEKQEYYLGEEI
jgi:hypothetical protein